MNRYPGLRVASTFIAVLSESIQYRCRHFEPRRLRPAEHLRAYFAQYPLPTSSSSGTGGRSSYFVGSAGIQRLVDLGVRHRLSLFHLVDKVMNLGAFFGVVVAQLLIAVLKAHRRRIVLVFRRFKLSQFLILDCQLNRFVPLGSAEHPFRNAIAIIRKMKPAKFFKVSAFSKTFILNYLYIDKAGNSTKASRPDAWVRDYSCAPLSCSECDLHLRFENTLGGPIRRCERRPGRPGKSW